jgi:hypothetical protein
MRVLVAAAVSPQLIKEWPLPEVAALTVANDLPGLPGASILATTFGPFSKDEVVAVGPLSDPAKAQVTTVSTDVHWPNLAQQVSPEDAKGAKLAGAHVLTCDGFIFPGKQTGAVSLLDVTQGLASAPRTQLSTDKHAWFYHHAEWLDVDKDGILDVVAARAIKPLTPWHHTDGELVWIKNNGDGKFGETEVLANGPGVGFTVVELDEGLPQIVASQFFKAQQLAVYSCAEASWALCGQKQSAKVTKLAGGPGPWFNVAWVDLNGDGKKDLLATQQQSPDGKTAGRVVALEQPKDWETDAWPLHVLADGYFPPAAQGSGSPGTASAVPFGNRVHVVFSSDDGGKVDWLVPGKDWEYTKQTVFETNTTTKQGTKTIGTVVTTELGGQTHLFVPDYADGSLKMFQIKAESQSEEVASLVV